MDLQLEQCWAVYYLDNCTVTIRKKYWVSVHVTKGAAEQVVNNHNSDLESEMYYVAQEVVGTFINEGNTFLVLGLIEEAIPVRNQNTLDS